MYRRRNSVNLNQEQWINFDYDVDFEELKKLIIKSDKDELVKIQNLITELLSENDFSKRVRRRLYIETEVECEYDIDFNDILNIISNCDFEQENEIKKVLGINASSNLYDDYVQRVLKVAAGKYSLEELQSRLDIKNNEY